MCNAERVQVGDCLLATLVSVSRRTAVSPLDSLELPPLTARSVLASALLGTTRGLSSRTLTGIGALFGVAPATSRVALSRMVAAGEVAVDDGRYKVAGPFKRRQARQEVSVSPQIHDWDGQWDMWIVRSSRKTAADRVALRNSMVELRLAEYREGVWIRPANLVDGPLTEAHQTIEAQAEHFLCVPSEDPAPLAGGLWELDAWAVEAGRLIDAMTFLRPEVAGGADGALSPGFMVLVAVVHHLGADPLLPTEILPANWPGDRLRQDFVTFEKEWQQLLATWRRSMR
jgi:phenylacetic acid degradation operon negative regulatory protein